MALLVDPLIEAIYAGYEVRGRSEPFRSHMGASNLGNECERRIQLDFRWASKGDIDGRVYRLFERGKREEEWLKQDLISAGIEIIAEQVPIASFALGHAGGTCDIIAKGFHEAPDKPHVVEGKTLSDWAFKALVKNGLEKAKPVYFAQCHIYMSQLRESHGVERAIFIAINKNTDEYYKERIRLDVSYVKELKAKAERLVQASRIAPNLGGVSASECKYCHLKKACYDKNFIPEFNCRTCLHSTPMDGGSWYCSHLKKDLSDLEQRRGCNQHLFHPDMLSMGDPIKASEEEVHYRGHGGELVINKKGGEIRRKL